MQVEEPISGWDGSSFDFHPILPRMLGVPLIGDQVIQVGEPGEQRLVAPLWVVKPFHGEELPLDGVVGLI